ncbi:MAG: DEAD/DEAH box helicase [Bacteroidales bacterium]|nr:DEAD/DEAH box helicase [Bacteroidales bacterium]
MKNYQTEFLSQYISNLRISKSISRLAYQAGNALYLNNQCVLQSREGEHFAFTVEDDYQDFKTDIFFDDDNKKIEMLCNCKAEGFCSHKVAALMQLHEDLSQELDQDPKAGMKYTREGMINRVMAEREEKAKTEKFQLDFADNIYGEHLITNQRNKSYTLTFYDFETEQGYCSCPDHHTNKLGTCKHLIFAFDLFKKQYVNKALPVQDFPFLEVFLHPLNEYRIAWFYPGKLAPEIQELVNRFFNKEKQILDKQLILFQDFIAEAQQYKFINIRPEVIEKVRKELDRQSLIELKAKNPLDFDTLNIAIAPFQKEGVEFIVFNKSVILADDISLGKPLQAVIAAQYKKEIFNFKSALIICPDSLIPQWQQEIQKAVKQKSELLKADTNTGSFDSSSDVYFKILGFDDFSSQSFTFDHFAPDLLIVDEAQNISSFDSDLVRIIRGIQYKQLLIITDSKPENNLMQLYTMIGLVDNTMLTPLWEFSYQHCLFDSKVLDEIVGYYNQETLVKRLEPIMLRREKEDVRDQLPDPNQLKEKEKLSVSQASSTQQVDLDSVQKHLNADKYRQKRKYQSGQTSLFPLSDKNKKISLSGEEHKVFERPKIKKTVSEPTVERLLAEAHSFLSSLYTLQTGEDFPWKTEDIDIKMNEKEIVLRIKRK